MGRYENQGDAAIRRCLKVMALIAVSGGKSSGFAATILKYASLKRLHTRAGSAMII